MRKKVLSVLLCTAMAATLLTGCGGSDATSDTASSNASSEASSEAEASKADVSDGGKVLNIRCWNDEFQRRVKDHYPGYEEVDKEYARILVQGGRSVLEPTTEPWGQRTCYIADPEGNLIEIGSFNRPFDKRTDVNGL